MGLSSTASADALEYYRCSKVIDGDTIELEGVGKVRLIGVDCPESGQRQGPNAALAMAATAFTRGLVEGKPVRLEYDEERTDIYKRTLAYAFLPDSTFVNAAIVESGYGEAYIKYPFRYAAKFLALERSARDRRLGIWERSPTSPGTASGLISPGTGIRQGAGADESGITVYITRTGKKYHREGCRHLARSMIPMALAEASLRFGPCGTCRPPVLSPTSRPGAASGIYDRGPPATSTRCQATTKKGTQCKRSAKAGSSYCWQHGG
ncbi:MAG TPA: thermonuclease family protein [Candidatus Eisenbacteria bacterium]|nr:thermonuclease family protein [Candidatus Eisenbacteria bacterium]